jgi:hypothetical protein
MKHLKRKIATWLAVMAARRAHSVRIALRETVRRDQAVIAWHMRRHRGLVFYAAWLVKRQPANVIHPGRGLAALIPDQKRRVA